MPKFKFDRRRFKNRQQTSIYKQPTRPTPSNKDLLENEPPELGESYIGRITRYGKKGDPIVFYNWIGGRAYTVIIAEYDYKRKPPMNEIVAYQITDVEELEFLAFAKLVGLKQAE